jgi:molybdopterin molybdotransferase
MTSTLREPSWPDAMAACFAAPTPLPAQEVPLSEALGTTLAHDLLAQHPLPPFDTAMMDGWAVCGPPPWRVVGQVLAGSTGDPLTPGRAVGIATGAQVPDGATAILRREWGVGADAELRADRELTERQDIRRCGDEAAAGDELLPAGTAVRAPVVGLAALSGHDTLAVRRRPTVQALVLGDELLDSGLPRGGRVRDALGPQVLGWAEACDATGVDVTRVTDTLEATVAALRATTADVVLTTGGTARGPVDHMHAALDTVQAQLVVDEVAVRPGHPMLMAALPDNRFVIGLPGNPMSAAVAFLSLGRPVLAALAGRAEPSLDTATLTDSFPAPPTEHRLVPAVRAGGRVTPLPFQGSAMLRSVAVATCFAVAQPGGAEAGSEVLVLPIPW